MFKVDRIHGEDRYGGRSGSKAAAGAYGRNGWKAATSGDSLEGMRVSFEGDLYRGSHISGPTHNYLGLRLKPNRGVAEVTVLPPAGECRHHDGLAADEVRQWISEGVARANDELGTDYGVSYAEVVENDSRRPEVYSELARRIVKEAHGLSA